ncbi:helix-turn-helix domain-containing protein [Streptomyces sp. NPDC056231]|uniref:helix-turn-helix domain-containing protein n=1 Tax=Streptomyces sp. NPDC056231 TaxID=3345755 RepID=UPI003AAF9829
MPRQISYRWRLRELMAARGMFTVTELMPHLSERGITLSASQVHRLVSGTPERLSMPVLAALLAARRPKRVKPARTTVRSRGSWCGRGCAGRVVP